MGKASVALVRVKEIESSVREAILLIGGMRRFVEPGNTVLIKPNLSYRGGLSTRSDICRALAKISLEAEAGKVVIGEGMLGESGPRPEHFEKLGYKKVADELGISLLNLNECEPVEVEIDGASVAKKVKISKPVLEADCLINVPIMKTHFLASVTLGLKNLKGCLSGYEKSKFHLINLHRAIADLNFAITPRLTVIDAVTAGEGMGPHFVDEVKMDLIIASDDNLAADIAGATVMGYEPREIQHLRIFARRKGKAVSLRDVQLVGLPIDGVRRSFVRPPQELDAPEGVEVIGNPACSGCICSLAYSFFLFRKNHELDRIKGYTFVIGRDSEVPEGKEKLFIVGNCAKDHKDRGIFAKGCPPSAENLPHALFKNLFKF